MAAWVTAVVIVIIALFNILCYALNETSWVWKRLCCGAKKGPVVISQRSHSIARSLRPQQRLAWDLIDAQHLYTGIIGTPGLLLYRLFCFAVFVVTVVYAGVLYGPAPKFPAMFTNWTYVLWGFTSIYGAALTAQVWHSQRHPQQFITNAASSQQAKQQPAWLVTQQLHLLLLVTVAAASLTLTAFYWAAVYVKGEFLRFDNPVKHGASAFLLLVELLVSRAPLVSYHVQVPIAYGTLYLVFMWIYQAVTQEWLYGALNWARPISIIFYIALPILIILSFAVMFVVVAIRELCYTRKCFIQCACCCAACSCCRPAESDLVQAQVQLPPADMEAGAAAAKKAAGRAAAYAVPTGQRM